MIQTPNCAAKTIEPDHDTSLSETGSKSTETTSGKSFLKRSLFFSNKFKLYQQKRNINSYI